MLTEDLNARWQPPRWRIVTAFGLSPITSTGLLVTIAIMSGFSDYDSYQSLFVMAFLGLGFPSALVFGLPLYFVLRRWIWTTWWVSTVAGALWGIVEFTAMAVLVRKLNNQLSVHAFDVLRLWALGIVFGASGGLSFWLAAALGERRGESTAHIFA